MKTRIPEEKRSRSLASYYANKEDRLKKAKEWKAANKERIKEYRALYKRLHPEKHRGDVTSQQQRAAEKRALLGLPSYSAEWRQRLRAVDPARYAELRRAARARERLRLAARRVLAFMIWAHENPSDYLALVERAKPKSPKPILAPEELAAKADEAKRRRREHERAYALRHPDKMREKRRLKKKRRLARDPAFKLRHYIGKSLSGALRGAKKSASTLTLVGLPSWDDFRAHIESTWTAGMSWDNYGVNGWHIDHIRPQCSFDMTKPEEQAVCWNYKNLQALWGYENVVIKGGRTDYYEQKPL
jgi:hypothetical protein